MSAAGHTAGEPLLKEPHDFSLVLGGPLFQLWRRTHLAGDALQLLRPPRGRADAALVGAAAAVVVAEGHAWGGASRCRSSTTWSCTCACWWRCRC